MTDRRFIARRLSGSFHFEANELKCAEAFNLQNYRLGRFELCQLGPEVIHAFDRPAIDGTNHIARGQVGGDQGFVVNDGRHDDATGGAQLRQYAGGGRGQV